MKSVKYKVQSVSQAASVATLHFVLFTLHSPPWWRLCCVGISVGVLADTALKQPVADITGGVHSSVPGGQTIARVRTQLEAAFRQIASSRPLRLVDGD